MALMGVTTTPNAWPTAPSKPGMNSGTISKPLDWLSTAKKTAFIVTDNTTHKDLAKLLEPDDPPIQTVMGDLGIDHAAGRRRRIATLQQKFKKNRQRRIKLRNLKLPNLKTRLRLHKGGVQPVAFWGFEGQGLAPRYWLALRQSLAVHLGPNLPRGTRSSSSTSKLCTPW